MRQATRNVAAGPDVQPACYGGSPTAVPRWASKRHATTSALRAGQDAPSSRLGGHGSSGLRGIQLTFLARAGGPLLAAAQGPAACGTVQFSVGGKRQPALQITDSFIPQVLKLADLNWKVP